MLDTSHATASPSADSAPSPAEAARAGECPTLPPRFALGRVVATPGALQALEAANLSPFDLLARHGSGDWGDLSKDDTARNNEALVNEGRLLSAYALPDTAEAGTGVKIWIITEWDRSATTLLLPSEY